MHDLLSLSIEENTAADKAKDAKVSICVHDLKSKISRCHSQIPPQMYVTVSYQPWCRGS